MSKTVMTKSISRSSLLEFYFFFSSDITLFRIKTYIWLQDSLLRVIISVGSLVDRVLKWVCVITIVKMRSLPKLLLWPITTYRQYHGIDLKLQIGRSTNLHFTFLLWLFPRFFYVPYRLKLEYESCIFCFLKYS